jgi:drug/metabolite transporter (DMT)-like permease
MQMITGGVALLILSIITGEVSAFDFSQVTGQSVMALVYLTIPGSVAFAAYIWLIKASSPAKAATYAYVNPVIALILGNLLAGEKLSLWTIGCAGVITFAVALIVTARGRGDTVTISDKDPRAVPIVVPESKSESQCGCQ